MTANRRAIISISEELLIDALHMPPDTRILIAYVSDKYDHKTIHLVVEHEDLPPVEDSCFAQVAFPIVHAKNRCPRCNQVTEYGWDWNIQETEEKLDT